MSSMPDSERGQASQAGSGACWTSFAIPRSVLAVAHRAADFVLAPAFNSVAFLQRNLLYGNKTLFIYFFWFFFCGCVCMLQSENKNQIVIYQWRFWKCDYSLSCKKSMSAEYEASVSIAQTGSGSKYMFGSFRWTQKDRTSCCYKHVDVALTGCLVRFSSWKGPHHLRGRNQTRPHEMTVFGLIR